MDEFDIGLGLENSHVLVTGGTGAIGSIVVKWFLAAGCYVTVVDLKKPGYELRGRIRFFEGDVADEKSIKTAFKTAREEFGLVQVCVAIAGKDLSFIPHHQSMADLPLEQWRNTMRVNADGTFLTAREWMRGIRDHAIPESKNLSLIVFGSEAGSMGVKSNADYAASKAAISFGLIRSLASDVVALHPSARVNAVMPGPVDTPQFRKECEEDPLTLWIDAGATVAQKRPTSVDSIAKTCLYLASEWASSVNGQQLAIDGGKSGKMFWLANGNAV